MAKACRDHRSIRCHHHHISVFMAPKQHTCSTHTAHVHHTHSTTQHSAMLCLELGTEECCPELSHIHLALHLGRGIRLLQRSQHSAPRHSFAAARGCLARLGGCPIIVHTMDGCEHPALQLCQRLPCGDLPEHLRGPISALDCRTGHGSETGARKAYREASSSPKPQGCPTPR